jgi:hypothetical protein
MPFLTWGKLKQAKSIKQNPEPPRLRNVSRQLCVPYQKPDGFLFSFACVLVFCVLK